MSELAGLRPDRDDAEAADKVTEHVLTLLGMDADEARRSCQLPLPELDS